MELNSFFPIQFGSILNIVNGAYDPPDSQEITVLLSQDNIDEFKEQIESKGIDLKAAGLEDMQIRKMLLTTYKTLATDHTCIAFEIDENEYYGGGLSDDKNELFYRFENHDISGKCKYYMATKGIVNLVTFSDTGQEVSMYCYDENKLNEIKDDYDNATTSDRKNEIKAVLNRSYTVKSIGSISMYQEPETVNYKVKSYIYSTDLKKSDWREKAGLIHYKIDSAYENLSLEEIDYIDDIEEYSMPLELLTTMLQLTASPDFVLKICELVKDSEITAFFYRGNTKTVEVEEIKSDLLIDIQAKGSKDITIKKGTSTITQATYDVNLKRTYTVIVTKAETWWCHIERKKEFYNSGIISDVDINELWKDYGMDGTTLWDSDDLADNWRRKSVCLNTYKSNESDTLITEEDKYYLYGLFDYNIDYISINNKTNADFNEDDILDFVGEILKVEYQRQVDRSSEKKNADMESCKIYLYNQKKRTYTMTRKVKYTSDITHKEDKSDKFINLLKNSDTGENISYADWWGSVAVVGRMIGYDAYESVFYYLENNGRPDTADIMRYILYRYSGEDYGITDINQLLRLFNNMNSMGKSSSQELLTSYIHGWEGAPKTNADGTNYIVFDDGAGNPTVGWGVDINSYETYFSQAGYSVDIGSEIPIDFVDSIEKSEINSDIKEIEAATSGLNLTEYQINALVSRAYNCGVRGAIYTERGSPSYNFAESYKEYWKQDRDDKFEKNDSNADFNHKLYTQYMSMPNTSNNVYMKGLEERRKSEWALFQTGYYDKINEWHTSGGSILECAKVIHEYMEKNDYTYCVLSSNTYEECGKYGRLPHKLSTTFEASKSNKKTCCATYVSWVLQEAGYLEESEHKNGANELTNLLISKGWTVITDSSQFQAGDILTYDHHVEIFAGDGKIYNAGSGNAIRGASPSNVYRKCTKALRAPN